MLHFCYTVITLSDLWLLQLWEIWVQIQKDKILYYMPKDKVMPLKDALWLLKKHLKEKCINKSCDIPINNGANVFLKINMYR